jgi:hypothetical protein
MGNELSIRELRDETRQFEHARDLIADAEHGEWPEVEDPGQCYNCGAFAKTYDGHTYVCPVCGDEWDTWFDPLEDLGD